jgi:glycosyltransferase involved in cell wall biosynthesis
VIAVRNEAQYLRILLPLLASQEIDVVIIDNDSTDGSKDLFSSYMGEPILSVQQLPFHGFFSLYEQLETKHKVYETINHDWVLHLDADEILEHYQPGRTLRDAIQEAHESGHNVLNFDEFVFLPSSNAGVENYYTDTLQYYFFEPQKMRLNRAWRRDMFFDNRRFGGHSLAGGQLIVFPTNHILRHYIVLSHEHAKAKYLDRKFSEKEIRLGWHKARLNLSESDLLIPSKSPFLFRLPTFDSKEFRRDFPLSEHYWLWGNHANIR